MINISAVSKYYKGAAAPSLDNVSLTIEKGELLVILGASGSGKTTLLKTINRLVEPSSGRIDIDGEDTAVIPAVQLRRQIGYVFQHGGLFPHMSVEDNIAIVLRLLGEPAKKRKHRAHELLELINLDPKQYAKRYPHELSGGQQQRVGVARALASNPDYLLMDEPFGALDSLTRSDLQQEILELKKHIHKTIVFVTHDIMEAARLGDRIAVMSQGRLQQVGPMHELVNAPKTDYVKKLLSEAKTQFSYFYDEHVS